jgi:hypothetical protein
MDLRETSRAAGEAIGGPNPKQKTGDKTIISYSADADQQLTATRIERALAELLAFLSEPVADGEALARSLYYLPKVNTLASGLRALSWQVAR